MASTAARLELTDRGIGITGGGGHLGRAMSLGLAAAGARVVICGRSRDKLDAVAEDAERARLPGSVTPVQADVGVDTDVERVLDAVEHQAGAVHGWVNNAYGGPAHTLLEATRTEIDDSIRSGLTDVIMATQAAAKRMIPTGRGSIVQIASMYGMVSPQPAMYESHPQFHNPPAYGAAKAGVITFTRYAACHLGRHGIRVNAISPGPFPSPTVAEHSSFIDELAQRTALGQTGEPEQLVAAVQFLLADGSDYVTGHNLTVDGGWTAW